MWNTFVSTWNTFGRGILPHWSASAAAHSPTLSLQQPGKMLSSPPSEDPLASFDFLWEFLPAIDFGEGFRFDEPFNFDDSGKGNSMSCTMRRCLPSSQTAVAFVVPLSPSLCRCRCWPPSQEDAADVVGRNYRMPSSAAVVGWCCRRLLGRVRRPQAAEVRGVALVSAVAKNIAKPIQQLRLPVLRHQAEVQITISAKPGAHEAHMGHTWTYARRKKKLKSL